MNKDVLNREQVRSLSIIEIPKTSILNRGKVRRLVGGLIRNNPVQLLRLGKDKKYLNIGCGGNLFKDFINIDYGWVPKQDLCWNILKPLPVPSNSVEGIFTEHTLEHFTMREIQDTLLPEFLRILVPNGVIRISVPDAEKAVERYNQAKAEGLVDVSFVKDEANSITPMMYLNNTFRQIYAPLMVGHKFAFDYQTLEFFLKTSGFVDIKNESYMCGRNEKLLIDFQRRASESMYVEAAKPNSGVTS